MRVRRLHKRPAALEVTAFINLIVVLVPFLLSTAVFSRLAVVELTLPAQASGVEKLKGDLQLEVVIRPDGLNVGDRIGGQIMWIANQPSGYDYRALAQLMLELKGRFPDKTDASILAEPGTPYDVLVGVMDAVRETRVAQGANVVKADLFPEISIGDAPVRAAGAGS
ncbi:MAG TPA: biopolymer transporter ExbD [Burkholderiaceae bacterium]|jgi:biopolymer transport protein ExbD|nr:biopolymer transporter ExbD [Burkholderiaceae bacterium]